MTDKIVSDNCATRAGWIEYLAVLPDGTDMHVSVPPEADLDDTVRAFWHDEQRMVGLKGWLVEFQPVMGV